jgi:hypothetical protein
VASDALALLQWVDRTKHHRSAELEDIAISLLEQEAGIVREEVAS